MSDGSAFDVPSYAELPRIEKLDMPHAWEAFGAGDELGTINHLTPERVLAAAGLVRDGVVVNLCLPLDQPDPPLLGRERYTHEVIALDRNTFDDRLEGFNLQGSSQWDGLRHLRAREFGFYGGVLDDPQANGGPLGVDRYAQHGIVGRGVLLDLDRFCRAAGAPLDTFSGDPVELETIVACAEAQSVELRPGDVLCFRFGWIAAYRALDRAGREAYVEHVRSVGLAAGEEVARYLWDARVAAVVADNPAVEASPGTPGEYLHRRLLPLLGFALGELFDFERLAELCAADGRYEFLFASAPLNVPGGVGSPANALAIR